VHGLDGKYYLLGKTDGKTHHHPVTKESYDKTPVTVTGKTRGLVAFKKMIWDYKKTEPDCVSNQEIKAPQENNQKNDVNSRSTGDSRSILILLTIL